MYAPSLGSMWDQYYEPFLSSSEASSGIQQENRPFLESLCLPLGYLMVTTPLYTLVHAFLQTDHLHYSMQNVGGRPGQYYYIYTVHINDINESLNRRMHAQNMFFQIRPLPLCLCGPDLSPLFQFKKLQRYAFSQLVT